MEAGGYYLGSEVGGPLIGETDALAWAPRARGLEWDLKKFFPPEWYGTQREVFVRPQKGDHPSFIARRFHHWRDHEAGREAAYEELREQVIRNKSSRRVPITLVAGLRALRETLTEEIAHRAARAAHYTAHLPRYFAPLVAEAYVNLGGGTERVDREGVRDLDHWREQWWREAAGGLPIEGLQGRYRKMAERFSGTPDVVWDAQWNTISCFIEAREPELHLAVSLTYRLEACEEFLRCVAFDDPVYKWGVSPTQVHPDSLIRLSRFAAHLSLRHLALRHEAQRNGEEEPPIFPSLSAFCEAAASELERDPDTIKDDVKRAGLWRGTGKGKADPEAVRELVEKLEALHNEHRLRYE